MDTFDQTEAIRIATVYGPVGHVEQVPGESPRLVMLTDRWKEVQDVFNKAGETGQVIPCRDKRVHHTDDQESTSLILQSLSQGELSSVTSLRR